MLGCSLVLALALGPEAVASEPPAPGALPHWRNVAETPPEPPNKPPPVPSDGSGAIALGSVLLGTGGAIGLMTTAFTIANNPEGKDWREMAAVASVVELGAGTVLLTLGLVGRRKFRASEAGSIPDAPRTGGGMILGGLGLMAGGTAFAAQAVANLATLQCGGQGCHVTRPIGAPTQLGFAVASVAVGTGLMVVGVHRRRGYQRWAVQRAKLQPTFGVSPTSVAFGIAGRF